MARFMIAGWILLSPCFLTVASAQEATDQRVDRLEQQVDALQGEVGRNVSVGGSAFLFGAFCALWAQNTGRNAWLWFFLGLIFSVITVLVLLYKNSADRQQGEAVS